MTLQQLKTAISEVQYHTIFTNAFPSRDEQTELLEDMIRGYPHGNDIGDLITKVSNSISSEY